MAVKKTNTMGDDISNNVIVDIEHATSEAVRLIVEAAETAARGVAVAAIDASRAVAEAAAISVKVLNVKSADDHDLLIELKTRMENLRDDIKDLKDKTTQRIQDLEVYKVEKKEFEELRKEVIIPLGIRVRSVENKTSNYTITLTLFTTAVVCMFGLILFHIFRT